MAGRILVIRGGAIGDFILTLPALRLLREAFPNAHIELLGYKHIIALAHERFYADATRSIEYGPLAGFFSRKGTLDPEMTAYFAGFDQIVSYLFDPDHIFAANLRKSGVANLLPGFSKMHDGLHAAYQLAAPLQSLALYLEDPAARVHPSATDHAAAEAFLGTGARPFFSLHPGSGSEKKNWPVPRWLELLERLRHRWPEHRVLIVGGEADGAKLAALRAGTPADSVFFAENLPLTTLAAVLRHATLHLGHDSGISHLAAAVGVPSALLFGPTDPDVWAPRNPRVTVLRETDGEMESITVDAVEEAVRMMARNA